MPNFIRAGKNIYELDTYSDENDLEATVVELRRELFGTGRIYVDVKRAIGSWDGKRIPDGYLIDLSQSRPKLYLVENELERHSIDHIVMQVVGFSLSFKSDRLAVKKVLLEAVHNNRQIKEQCEHYVRDNDVFKSIDHLIEFIVFDIPFAVVVVIDEIEISGRLYKALKEEIKVSTEILSVARYKYKNDFVYLFDSFLDRFTEREDVAIPAPEIEDIDTLIVAAQEDGFNETFLGENRWHHIRISGIMLPRIKYIAAYRTRPESKITHFAEVASIEPWEDTDKFVVNFSGAAIPLENPIRGGKRLRHIQGQKYTAFSRLQNAKSLDDL